MNLYMFSPFFKTFLLLGTLSALFIGIGYAIGGPENAWFFFIVSLILNIGSYWFSDKIALRMSHAIPLSREKAPEIHGMVEKLALQMNIPVPAIYYMSHPQANAFATGRNPKHSAICLTQGIMKLLNRQELEAVIAHELSHIKNRDVLVATIAAVLASAITNISHLTAFGHNSRDNNGYAINNIFLIFLAPVAAFLIQLAVSRQREFLADESGAIATRHPEALANALQKIERSVLAAPMSINPALASLYLENPLKLSGLTSLFSTHPSTDDRVEKLLNLRF